MGRVTLDSSVLLAILYSGDAHHEIVVKHLAGRDDQFFISAITLAETLMHAYKVSPRAGATYKLAIDSAVKGILPANEEVAVHAAKLRAKTGLRIPDAIISATATVAGAELWTLDQRLAKAHKGAVLIT